MVEQEGEEKPRKQTQQHACNPDAAACDFYLRHKRRFCRTVKRVGGRYCATHDVTGTQAGDETASATPFGSVGTPSGSGQSGAGQLQQTLLRVPCPINPNHTVYASKLQKHVKVCPDLRFVVEKLPYYSRDLHAYKGRVYCTTELQSETHRFTHHQMDAAELEGLIARVQECYFTVIKPHIVLFSEEYDGEGDPMGITTRRVSTKHGPQHRALLHCIKTTIDGYAREQVRNEGSSVTICGFLELGAGKAGLAVSLQEALLAGSICHHYSHYRPQEGDVDCADAKDNHSDTVAGLPHIVVVDVDNFRRKGDACVRNTNLPLTRLRINIKDLDLGEALRGTIAHKRSRQEGDGEPNEGVNGSLEQTAASKEQWVAVGKHLCGACTDFALSCITAPNLVTQGSPSVCAVVFATCCHQRCELRHLNALSTTEVGAEGFIGIPGTKYRFSAREFAVMTSMSSWAVSGDVVSAERRLTGVCCKGIIDRLRLEYLRRNGFRRGFLCQYTDSSVTAENICIAAYR